MEKERLDMTLCYSHSGGDFLYHCSTGVGFAERILRTYTGGKYRRLEQHRAVLVPDVEE